MGLTWTPSRWRRQQPTWRDAEDLHCAGGWKGITRGCPASGAKEICASTSAPDACSDHERPNDGPDVEG